MGHRQHPAGMLELWEMGLRFEHRNILAAPCSPRASSFPSAFASVTQLIKSLQQSARVCRNMCGLEQRGD